MFDKPGGRMIWVDFAIIGLVFIYSAIGLLHGFGREIFSLTFWILAVWVGLGFSHEFSRFLEPNIGHPLARIAASFVCLFVITLVLGALIGFLSGEEIVNKTGGLTISDRLLGMIFGCVRGLVVVAVMIMLAGLTPLPKDSWWKESQLIPPFQSLALWVREHGPSGMAGHINYRY